MRLIRRWRAEVADRLRALCEGAAIDPAQISTQVGTARFPSLQQWVFTEIRGWTLADALDDVQYALLLREAERALHRFVQADGTVAFASPAHIVTLRP